MGLNGTMKVGVYYNNRDVRVEERPVPTIGPGELLVQTKACGVCGGDAMEWYLVHKAPVILGHEPTGVVVEVGAGVKEYKVGDRIFVHHHVPCFSCHECRRGFFTMCEHFTKTNIHPGGFAEYFRVPAENVQHDTHKLPDHLSFEEGTLVEPMACVVKGIKLCGIKPGDTVAVVGAGLMGLGFLQLARVWGAGKIIALDFSDWRLQKARKLGADETINSKTEDALARLLELNGGRGADSVIVTPNGIRPLEFGLTLCGKGATLHMFAPPAPDEVWSVKPNDLFFREITFTTTYSASHIDTPPSLEFIAGGRINAREMVTHRFGLEGIAKAIDLIKNAGESIKSVIIPEITRASI
jgi:L-iditol 2-dehydrogenase